jgi:phosphopantetheinyl transferase
MIDVWLRRGASVNRHRWIRDHIEWRLGVSSDGFELRRNEAGALLLDDGIHTVSFSDHGSWLSLAISSDGAVGLDVLTFPSDAGFVGDTALVLSPAEIAYVRAMTPEHQGAVFAECWTRKEAYAKWLGTGLAAGLAETSLTPMAPSDLGVELQSWHIGEIAVALASNTGRRSQVALHLDDQSSGAIN